MIIASRDFGEVEVKEEQLVHFPNGIYAFEEAKNYALITPLGDSTFPMWLQCVDDVSPCFIVFDPALISTDYEVSLSPDEKTLLKITDDRDITALCIAKVPADYRDTTVNMKSPLIVNKKERLGMQIILPSDYPFRLPLYRPEKEVSVCSS